MWIVIKQRAFLLTCPFHVLQGRIFLTKVKQRNKQTKTVWTTKNDLVIIIIFRFIIAFIFLFELLLVTINLSDFFSFFLYVAIHFMLLFDTFYLFLCSLISCCWFSSFWYWFFFLCLNIHIELKHCRLYPSCIAFACSAAVKFKLTITYKKHSIILTTKIEYDRVWSSMIGRYDRCFFNHWDIQLLRCKCRLCLKHKGLNITWNIVFNKRFYRLKGIWK